MGLSRQEYWSGLLCLPPGIFLTQESNPHLLCLLHWEMSSLPLTPPGKPVWQSRALWWPKWKSKKRGYMCKRVADSLCCTADTNNTVKQLQWKFLKSKAIFITIGKKSGMPQYLHHVTERSGQPDRMLEKRNGQLLVLEFQNGLLGLPWWSSGKESACYCRRHGFVPWSRNIPHAVEELSPCSSIIEPVL